MLDAILRTVDRRDTLPPEIEILVGEADAIGYGALQDALGRLMHGTDPWRDVRVPKSLAAAGAWLHGRMEPVIPDAMDGGEPAFIRPFMVAMADHHYALDIRRARVLLGWAPQHCLADELPTLLKTLKADPVAWYAAHGIAAPGWVAQAGRNAGALRTRHDAQRKAEHRQTRWAHFVNLALGSWLVTQPPLVGVPEPLLRGSEITLGLLLIAGACLALSWRMVWARWLCAGIGSAVMALPFLASSRVPWPWWAVRRCCCRFRTRSTNC